MAFVQWLKYEHSNYLVEHERRRIAREWTEEEYPLGEESPIPRPIFYNIETRRFEVEPWFQPQMASWEPTAGPVAA